MGVIDAVAVASQVPQLEEFPLIRVANLGVRGRLAAEQLAA